MGPGYFLLQETAGAEPGSGTEPRTWPIRGRTGSGGGA